MRCVHFFRPTMFLQPHLQPACDVSLKPSLLSSFWSSARSLMVPRHLEGHGPRQTERLIRMRQRLLTLPVLVAITVSLVWRRVPSIAEVQKLLAHEGWLGVAPLRVSPQAIIKRLDVLPAAVLGQLL